MTTLKIGTWDIKNSYFNIRKNDLKAAAVNQLLRNQDLDILALQEVNPLLARKIERNLKLLNEKYQVTTTYEKTLNPIKNLRVEYNMIISKMEPILISATEALSSTPKGIKKFMFWERRKRNVVTQILEKDLIVDVTHLDHTSEELGRRQMNEVVDLTKKQREAGYNVILAGNLNKKPSESNMIEFSEQLSEVGMQIVENNNKTYIGHTDEQPVDYVIIPTDWEVESIETLKDYGDISSHRPVVVEATLPKKLVLCKEM